MNGIKRDDEDRKKLLSYLSSSSKDFSLPDYIQLDNKTNSKVKLIIKVKEKNLRELEIPGERKEKIDFSDLSEDEKKQIKITISELIEDKEKVANNIECLDLGVFKLRNKLFPNNTISFELNLGKSKEIIYCDLNKDWKYIDLPVELPEDPGDEGKKTIQGISTNAFGIRDDVLRWIIADSNVNSIQASLLINITKKYNNIISNYENKEGNEKRTTELLDDIELLYNLNYNFDEFLTILSELESVIINTEKRFYAYKMSDISFSGSIYELKNKKIININSKEDCFNKIKTKFYFGNGMNNTKVEALISAIKLKILYNLKPEDPRYEYVSFNLAYNENEESFKQIYNVFQQKLEDNRWYKALKWLNGYEVPPQVVQFAILNTYSLLKKKYNDNDLNSFYMNYKNDLENFNTVVLISHSQGNFYANEVGARIYNEFSNDPKKIHLINNFYNYQFATPTSFIANMSGNFVYSFSLARKYENYSAGCSPFISLDASDEVKKCSNFRYFTNYSDKIINTVRFSFGSLPGNIDVDQNLNTDKILNHSFIGSYLSNSKISEILKEYIDSVSVNYSYSEDVSSINLNAEFIMDNNKGYGSTILYSFSDLIQESYWRSLWEKDYDESFYKYVNGESELEKLRLATIYFNRVMQSVLKDKYSLDELQIDKIESSSFFEENDPDSNILNNFIINKCNTYNLNNWMSKEFAKCFLDGTQKRLNNSNDFASIFDNNNKTSFEIKPHDTKSDEKYVFIYDFNSMISDETRDQNIFLKIIVNNKCKISKFKLNERYINYRLVETNYFMNSPIKFRPFIKLNSNNSIANRFNLTFNLNELAY